ncbi:hypothetical protein C4578_02270 [Candidatus Microgenomates bacterium]|jgi:hypothetical protein|nr:MAG: hypothetical protein C4578_02270 [Candidatus Microgenomates bacterium]
MYIRELPAVGELAKVQAQIVRYVLLTIFFGSLLFLSAALFGSDIVWSWDGFDPFLGERAIEGLAISFLTSGLEMLRGILVAGEVVKRKSPEYYLLCILEAVAYVVDIITNYLGISVRRGESAWGWTSDNAVATIVKAGLAIVVSFMEMFVFWFAEATAVCSKSLQAAVETKKQLS